MVLHNILITGGTLALAVCWTKGLSILQRRKKISRLAVRKTIHLTAGTMMAATWPLYTSAWSARFVAAIVPLVFAVQLRQSKQGDPLCESVSRSGEKSESREGPFWYCVSMASAILIFWRDSRATYAIVGAMCFGDGMAEVAGVAIRGPLWPVPKSLSSKKKSIIGTTAFLVSSVSSISLFMRYARATGICSEFLSWTRILMISTFCAAIEIVPLEDNISVPFSAAVIALM